MAILRAAPIRHSHTEQFRGVLTDKHLALTARGREGWEKPKHKASHFKTLCEELQASNCVYKSQGAHARGIGPPQEYLETLLTSTASRLTLPKLH